MKWGRYDDTADVYFTERYIFVMFIVFFCRIFYFLMCVLHCSVHDCQWMFLLNHVDAAVVHTNGLSGWFIRKWVHVRRAQHFWWNACWWLQNIVAVITVHYDLNECKRLHHTRTSMVNSTEHPRDRRTPEVIMTALDAQSMKCISVSQVRFVIWMLHGQV